MSAVEQIQKQYACASAVNNREMKLESFGFFLKDYVIQGAEIQLDQNNPRRFTITEGIVSFADGLWRVYADTVTLPRKAATYFVAFTLKAGYVVNDEYPQDEYLPLWQINTDATGNITGAVDLRGDMGYVKFRDEIQGIITDQVIVDEEHIAPEAVGTTRIQDKAVTEAKLDDESVSSRVIQDDAVRTFHILDKAVTYAKLGQDVTDLIDAIQSGDSGAAANAARYNSITGIIYNTLKERLDAEYKHIVGQLAQKITKGEVTVQDINKNKGKIDQTYLTDELLQQIAGNAPIHVIPADGSITREKLADRAITLSKLDNYETYRIDTDFIMDPGAINDGTGGNSNEGFITRRVRFRNITLIPKGTLIVSEPNYEFCIYTYKSDNTYTGYLYPPNGWTQSHEFTEDMYVRIVIRQISDGDFPNINEAARALRVYYPDIKSNLQVQTSNENILNPYNWERGTLYDDTGEQRFFATGVRVRTKDYVIVPSDTIVRKIDHNYLVYVYRYTLDGTYLGWVEVTNTYTFTPEYKYHILIMYHDETSIIPNKRDAINAIEIERVTNSNGTKIIIPKNIKTLIYSHRGDNNFAPENTMAAFRSAAAKGAKALEADVNVTKDGKFVLLHDNTIDRTSNGTGRVDSYTYNELLQFDFGSWFSPAFAGEKIPMLEELLLYCKIHGLRLELDFINRYPLFTTDQLTEILKLVQKHSMLERTCFSGPYSTVQSLVSIAKRNITVGVVYLSGPTQAQIDSIQIDADVNTVFISLPYRSLTESLAEYIHQKGMYISTWTVNDAATIRNLVAMGADSVISDNKYWSDVFSL